MQTFDYYTVPAVKENNPEFANRITRGLDTFGGLCYVDREYVLLGSEAGTETIAICRNHPELKLVDHLSAVVAENPGTALVVDIGDASNTDKYADGLVLSSGGTVLFTANPGVNNQDPVVTSDNPDDSQGDWIYATIMTATSLTEGQKVRFKLVFAANS
jgi:hypothetical protein